MSRSCKCPHILRGGCRKSFVGLAAWLLLSGVLAAQDPPTVPSKPDLSLQAPTGMPLKVAFPRVPGVKASEAVPLANSLGGQAYNGGSSFAANVGDAPLAVRRVTLEEAQQMAGGASNPLVRLGQLQVEIAKQHRLGVQAQYFPSIGATFFNGHLNKQTGQVLTLRRPIAGGTLSVPVNIIAKNQTVFDANATQPITPLFAIYQLVKIARADENIAKSKAGMPVAEATNRVEKNYFDLLVAERELITAKTEAKKIQAKWLTASNSGSPRISAEQEADMIAAEKAIALPASKVQELTSSLLEMVGLPEGTKLELVPPEPLVEDLSLTEVAARAEAANPEVVEAEQTAVKAHSGLKLSKMAYFPTVAVIGGYANQNLMSNAVLPKDFSYIGVLGTWTLFDFGKREHAVKEARAQLGMAETALQLTKAKLAADVKKSYFDLERTRQLSQVVQKMGSSTALLMKISSDSENLEVRRARADVELEMIEADFAHRQAFNRLKAVIDPGR